MANETITKTVTYVVLALLVVLAWGIAFGFIKRDVHYIGGQTEENKENIKVTDMKVDLVREQMIRFDTRQETVLKGIDQLNEKIK